MKYGLVSAGYYTTELSRQKWSLYTLASGSWLIVLFIPKHEPLSVRFTGTAGGGVQSKRPASGLQPAQQEESGRANAGILLAQQCLGIHYHYQGNI